MPSRSEAGCAPEFEPGAPASSSTASDEPNDCARPGFGLGPEKTLGVRGCFQDCLAVQVEGRVGGAVGPVAHG